MSLPLVLRVEARADFDEAFDWYERQRIGLGVEFANCVQASFDRISRNPELFGKILRNVRRAPVQRFPYSVLFNAEENKVVVVAVFHGKRDPKIWRARV